MSTIRKCMALIDPGARGRWIALAVMALAMSAIEIVNAVLLLCVLSYITGTDRNLRFPIIGELSRRFPNTDPGTLVATAMACLGLLFLFRGVLYLIQTYAQGRVAFDTSVRLSDRILRGYFAMPFVEFVRRSSAELQRNALDNPIALSGSVLLPAVLVVSEALILVGIAVVLVTTSPLLTIFVVVSLGLILLGVGRLLTPRLRTYGAHLNDLVAGSIASLQHSFLGQRDIRLYEKDEYFIHHYRDLRVSVARVSYLRNFLSEVPRITLETTVFLFIVLYVAATAITGTSTAGTLKVMGIFAYGVMRAMPSLTRIVASGNQLKSGAALVDTLYADVVKAEAQAAATRSETVSTVRFEQEIRFDDVTFRYEGADSDAVAGVSLRIRRGEYVGVVGPTGSGKSTLIDLLLGLLEPNEGTVSVDGLDIREARRAWQRRVGVVPQAAFLIDDTIRRNIALGVPEDEIDDVALSEAVEIAQLGPVLRRARTGLDARVGERGLALSGGERQRVSVARALYRQPDVLVFDEGTSALDNATEAALVDALAAFRSDRTIITVAHRLSTVERSDRLFVMSQGALVAEGHYDDLLANDPTFRSLAFRA
ncbi:MAG: transporter ATP-binding protein [Aeromicrobium sp.]|nr:transporter ATP-binding protein [Aeromicrobium sp.]